MSSHIVRTRSSLEWHFPMPKWMFFINALLLLWSVTLARTLPPILWDKNSANFTANGLNITVEINDLIDIECPKTENTTAGRLKAQYHKFTQVSSQGYRQCSLDAGRQRHLLSCNRPFVENKLTLLFQEHTPYPGGATFSHGENYYFITTSNGSANGIDNRSGGLCRSNNMRLRVYVKPKPTVAPTTRNPNMSTTTTPPTTVPTSQSTTPRATTRRRQTTISTTTQLPSTAKKTTRKQTEKPSTSTEDNKIANPQGTNHARRHHASVTLLLVAWVAAVVRWMSP